MVLESATRCNSAHPPGRRASLAPPAATAGLRCQTEPRSNRHKTSAARSARVRGGGTVCISDPRRRTTDCGTICPMRRGAATRDFSPEEYMVSASANALIFATTYPEPLRRLQASGTGPFSAGPPPGRTPYIHRRDAGRRHGIRSDRVRVPRRLLRLHTSWLRPRYGVVEA